MKDNLNSITSEELLKMCTLLEEFLKFIQSEKKVVEENIDGKTK